MPAFMAFHSVEVPGLFQICSNWLIWPQNVMLLSKPYRAVCSSASALHAPSYMIPTCYYLMNQLQDLTQGLELNFVSYCVPYKVWVKPLSSVHISCLNWLK